MDIELSFKALTLEKMKKTRRHYDREFKLMAIELLNSSNKTASQVARELEVPPDLLNRWRRELSTNEHSFQGNGNANLSEEQKEIVRLKKELESAKIEREILKKAISIFSKGDSNY